MMSSMQGHSLSTLSLHLCVSAARELHALGTCLLGGHPSALPGPAQHSRAQHIFVDERGNVAGSQEGRGLPVLGSSSSWA